MRNVNSILEMIEMYTGETVFSVLFLVALVTLLVDLKKKDTKYLMWLIVLSIVVILNDVSMKFLGMFTDEATFYRFLWAFPVLIVIAYVAVNGWSKLQGKAVKTTALALCVLMFVFGGSSYLTTESVAYPGTIEKIPGDVKKVCEIINENKQQNRPICVFDLSILLMVRSEEPSIVWGFTRKQYLDIVENGYDREDCKYPKVETLVKVVNDGIQVPKKKLKRALKTRKVEFLVVKKEFQMTDYFVEMGILPVDESDNYVVYQYIQD